MTSLDPHMDSKRERCEPCPRSADEKVGALRRYWLAHGHMDSEC